jgi:hypothetical protein
MLKFNLIPVNLEMRFRSFQGKALLRSYSISYELDVREYFPSQTSNFAIKAISYSSVGCNNLTGSQPYLFGLKSRCFDSSRSGPRWGMHNQVTTNTKHNMPMATELLNLIFQANKSRQIRFDISSISPTRRSIFRIFPLFVLYSSNVN